MPPPQASHTLPSSPASSQFHGAQEIPASYLPPQELCFCWLIYPCQRCDMGE